MTPDKPPFKNTYLILVIFFRETTEDLRVTAIPFFMGHQKKESGADSYWVNFDMNSLLILLRITKTFFFFVIAVEVQHPY